METGHAVCDSVRLSVTNSASPARMGHNLIVVNIYKHAFTFWHRPKIEPETDPKSDNLTTTPRFAI